jgi:DUF438 domain-containing protein
MSLNWTDLLMSDHEKTEKVFDAVANAFATKTGPSPEMVRDMLEYFTVCVDSCHNRKEQDYLFPLIEERGVPRGGGPLAVMLKEHEMSREILSRLEPLAKLFIAGKSQVRDELRAVFNQYSALLKDHFWKENDILYPMARGVLSAEDDEKIVAGIHAVEDSIGPDTRAKYYGLADRLTRAGEVRDLSTGLAPEVLAAILNTLPIELSFVDADDRVRYFSHENGKKIFPRSRGVIGNTVQNCHPKKSIHLVNQILEEFKAGKRDVAEFWIDMNDRKIHIRYLPVHSPSGKYLGTLETVQDIAPIQKLSGQKRLLD